MHWDSPAAAAFGDALAGLLADSQAAQRLLTELAAAVLAHQETSRRRARELAALASAALGELGRLLP
jgi:hypothetical protein